MVPRSVQTRNNNVPSGLSSNCSSGRELLENLAKGDDLTKLHPLSDNEATLLSLLIRAGPMTAYQIAKVYEDSPVSNFSTSKGKIYPLIRRLGEKGLIKAEKVPGDARGTERLESTQPGRRAVRDWVKEVRPGHLLLEDPLRTKVQAFDLLSRDERIEWIVEMKSQLLGKLEQVEEYGRHVEVPFQDFVHENAVRSLRSRMDWLETVLHKLVKERA
jgi:DNA-binding PadR family transcriptional regulator